MSRTRSGLGIAIRIVFLALLLAVGVLGFQLWRYWSGAATADPETVVSASLAGLREQNRLVPFTARFVAVVTSRETRFGLTAQKTLILPGTVRYEIDLEQLQPRDLAWNEEARALTVRLPPIRIAGPEVEMEAMREFRDGEIVLALTNAEQRLDAANRRAARLQIMAQAAEAPPMNLARAAARNAIERSFALPLRAAGIDATVEARF